VIMVALHPSHKTVRECTARSLQSISCRDDVRPILMKSISNAIRIAVCRFVSCDQSQMATGYDWLFCTDTTVTHCIYSFINLFHANTSAQHSNNRTPSPSAAGRMSTWSQRISISDKVCRVNAGRALPFRRLSVCVVSAPWFGNGTQNRSALWPAVVRPRYKPRGYNASSKQQDHIE